MKEERWILRTEVDQNGQYRVFTVDREAAFAEKGIESSEIALQRRGTPSDGWKPLS
jgi:hypothetical protein